MASAGTAQKPLTSGLLVLVLLFQIFAFGLWAGGPRVEAGKECVLNIALSPSIGHSINCDSTEFLQATADPVHIWGPEGLRQSRPGSVLLSWALASPLAAVLDLLSGAEQVVTFSDAAQARTIEIERNALVAGYVAFLFQHILILVIAYKLYLRLAGLPPETRGRLRTAVALAGMMVFINNITKEFLWSPHTQLFNLLAPLLSIWLFVRVQETEKPERFFLLAGLVCGIGCLFYGIFVLPAFAAGLGYLWRRRADLLAGVKQAARVIGTGAGAVALFALPYALWYGLIVWRNGEFYNMDVERFRGFVWLADVAAAQGWGRALYWLGHNFVAMFAGAFAQGWGFLLALAGLVLYARRLGVAANPVRLWVGAGIYALSAAVFFAFYGLTAERLSFTVTAALFPLIGWYLYAVETSARRPRAVWWLTLAAMGGYTLFVLAKYGPYS